MQLATLGLPRKPNTKRKLGTVNQTSMKVWQGPSAYDGRPIYLAITNLVRDSVNRKTGPTAYAWIMSAEAEPHTAAKAGDDRSCCGDCVRRPANGEYLKANGMKACYVVKHEAPLSIHRSLKDATPVGLERAKRALEHSGKILRWGAYGDPAMLPIELGRELSSAAQDHVGYSNQWHLAFAQPWQSLLMASVSSFEAMLQAQAMGWHTFRADKLGSAIANHETICPAYDTKNAVQCVSCKLCNPKRGRDVVIVEH